MSAEAINRTRVGINTAYALLSDLMDFRITLLVIGYLQEVPKQIKDLEKTAFETAQKGLISAACSQPYISAGTYYYTFLVRSSRTRIQFNDLILPHMKSLSSRPYRLLDIGAGNGLFGETFAKTHGQAVDVTSLSASDMRKGNSLSPNHHYLVANAFTCFSDSQFSSQPFDCVVSQLAFNYFPDSARILAECYSHVTKGGS